MSSLVRAYLNLVFYPFHTSNFMTFIVGILVSTWLFDTVHSLIRGDFS